MRSLLIVVIICVTCLPAYSASLPGETSETERSDWAASNIGRQPLSCTCNNETCNCCAKYHVPTLISSQIGCLQIAKGKLKSGYSVAFTVDGLSVWRQVHPGKMIPPICIPIPQFPLIRICLVISDVKFENGVLHMCPKVEVRLVPGSFTLLAISLDCVQVGKHGIGFVPSTVPSEFLGVELNKESPS